MLDKKKKIPLKEVISACIDAVKIAGLLIREVATSSTDLHIKDKTPLPSKDGTLVVNDPQTIADLNSQKLIIGSLKKKFGEGLTIIGEEGNLLEDKSLLRELCSGYFTSESLIFSEDSEPPSFPETLSSIDLEELVLWVDPLDGTKEFTSGIFEDVTVLIGGAIRGTPVFGVIGQPFFTPTHGRCVWGAIGVGVFEWIYTSESLGFSRQIVFNDSNPNITSSTSITKLTAEEYEKEREFSSKNEELVVVTSRTRMTPATLNAIEALSPRKVLRMGGSGAKFLKLLDEEADMYLFASSGTKKWDSCAGHAILLSLGGMVTDMYGKELSYGKNAVLDNEGLLATAQDYLHPTLVKACSFIPRSLDITKLANGQEISAQWISSQLEKFGYGKDSVDFYKASEETAIRGHFASSVRLHLETHSDSIVTIPKSLYLKKAVVSVIDVQNPSFLKEISHSFENEANFYYHISESVIASGIKVPKAFFIHSEKSELVSRDSKFLFLLQDFPEYTSPSILNFDQAKAAIHQIAHFHGFFSSHKHLGRLSDHLLKHGSIWSPEKETTGSFEKIASKWEEFIEKWKGESPKLREPKIIDLGKRLFKKLDHLMERVSPQHESSFRSIIHGDFRVENLLVSTDSPPICALMGFQWTGMGLNATDLVTLISTSLDASSQKKELDLIRFYYSEYTRFSGKKLAHFDELLLDYQYSFLVYFIFLIVSGWGIDSESDLIASSYVENGFPPTDISCVSWLVESADKKLEIIEKQSKKK